MLEAEIECIRRARCSEISVLKALVSTSKVISLSVEQYVKFHSTFEMVSSSF